MSLQYITGLKNVVPPILMTGHSCQQYCSALFSQITEKYYTEGSLICLGMIIVARAQRHSAPLTMRNSYTQ